MTRKQKLIRAMRKADMSGFVQSCALLLYDRRGFPCAMEYVNKIQIDREVME